MAQWNVTFNGFGSNGDTGYTWSHVNVKGHQTTPVYADDNNTVATIRHSISGTALINSTGSITLRQLILRARQRLNRTLLPGESMAIFTTGTSGSAGNIAVALEGGVGDSAGATATEEAESITQVSGSDPYHEQNTTVYYTGSEDDDVGLPSCECTINEIVGINKAIVAFTITWHKRDDEYTGINEYSVLSHTWSQEHNITEDGLTSIQIMGQLKVRNFDESKMGDGNVTDNDPNRGPDPDRYRQLVMPLVPDNFRIQNMKWVVDSSGTTLNYSITLKEYSRPLPSPAKLGSGSFVYRRELTGSGFMGVKVFQAELTGDSKAQLNELLASLLVCASSRINFGSGASTPVDLIRSIEVTEHDIFSAKRLSLKITAQGLQTTAPSGMVTTGDPGFSFLKSFFDNTVLEDAEAPNPYGSGLIKSVKRAMFHPYRSDSETTEWTNDNFPRALFVDASAFDAGSGEYSVTEIEEGVGTDPTSSGEHANLEDIQTSGHDTKPYNHVRGIERVRIHNNIKIMRGQHISAPDLVYQMTRPTVTLVSEYEISRTNKPPSRIVYKPPTNGIVIDEQINVERGPIDAQNNREYRMLYQREVELLYIAGGDAQFVSGQVAIPGFGSIDMILWWFPGNHMSAPLDHRVDSEDDDAGHYSNTVFSVNVFPLGGGPTVIG